MTRGGTVEAGETDAEAAARELAEELRLDLPLRGPIHTATDRFEHHGSIVTNTDIFFAGYCNVEDIVLHGMSPEKRTAMQVTRWWSADEIEESRETVFLPGLAELVRKQSRMARSQGLTPPTARTPIP